MRKLRLIPIIVVLAAMLHVEPPNLALGQNINDVLDLERKVIEFDSAEKYADALPLAQRLLTIQEGRLGPDHPDVARALFRLAAIYYGQGRQADAEVLLKRSLTIYEKAFGPDDLNEIGRASCRERV